MSDPVRDVFAFLAYGGILSAAAATIAWFVFRTFSDKWLASRFNERLERLKHDQQQEIEQLRGRINALLDRTTKLNQREYEVVPEAWERLWQAQASWRAGDPRLGLVQSQEADVRAAEPWAPTRGISLQSEEEKLSKPVGHEGCIVRLGEPDYLPESVIIFSAE